ncbi:MAG TPA: pantoate--beta-alanine ligase [Rhodoglobus sp.]|nr:pantoate--beta-alanine ligase [Rhodoglobus sp.]HQI65256.1 pantoate--beta-alanine ligase [Rhodoglobus sp.]HQJ34611.1 pantoate--beta-alanine ligase [Rhodoglobus sp.]
MPVTVAATVVELRSLIGGRRVALVPTMGALHDGHLALAARAVELVSQGVVDVVAASIFVNPLQFGPNEDLEKYPRTFDEDVAKLDAAGIDFVFAPTVEEMYPNGPLETKVTAGTVGSMFEGRSRPGHFDGVLTVVNKLLNIAGASAVLFGQKDAQQAFLVQRMVRDLSMPVRVEIVETVREESGLALSSRNRFLDAKEHRAARALSTALEAAASSADRGIDAVIAAAQSVLMGENLVELDYLAVVNPATFLPVDDDYRGPARVLIAARVGSTRLIDNERIRL